MLVLILTILCLHIVDAHQMGLFAQSGLRPANSMSLEDSDIEEKSVKERELLYEAYNSLHSLAQV